MNCSGFLQIKNGDEERLKYVLQRTCKISYYEYSNLHNKKITDIFTDINTDKLSKSEIGIFRTNSRLSRQKRRNKSENNKTKKL